VALQIVARAPNHLGDGVMALPAMHALARLGSLTIEAPRWGRDLYRGVDAALAARGSLTTSDVAVLFPPSFRVAWQARRAKRRIGVAADGRRLLLTDTVFEGRHRRDTYAALATAAGADVVGVPQWSRRESDPDVDVLEGHIGLNPLSVSGPVRQWPRFAELADSLERPVVFYGGPGEGEGVAFVAGNHRQVVGTSLPAFASALAKCAFFVSNDSGAAHFARACGTPTLVIYGSTAPDRTGPAGARAICGPTVACQPCYKQKCRHNYECMEIPLERVLWAVGQVVGE
jgi:heptosyltransferase II